MSNYKTFTAIADSGPFIRKLILDMPCSVGRNDVGIDSFNVYTERHYVGSDEVISSVNFLHPESPARPSKGYIVPRRVFPSDAVGNEAETGTCVTIAFDEVPLAKRIEGEMLKSEYIENHFRITQLKEIPGNPPVSGLVFDTCSGDVCPDTQGWACGEMKNGRLKYGFFTPDFKNLDHPAAGLNGQPKKPVPAKIPLVIWLHGAGEGGQDPRVAYTGNRVTALSASSIQRKLGGAAWVLAPQCPTVWMDDGREQLGHSNISIYTEDLKACIDEFVSMHGERIDTGRIYIGGCSNGGFMTIRMITDYPEYFAAAFPACEVFYEENITDEIVDKLRKTPIWFAHSEPDELVPPLETSIPLYRRLKKSGANVHFSYFDHMEDLTGMYKDEEGRPVHYFNHAVWIHVFNDDCIHDFEGTTVIEDGVPVTLWGWVGKQRLVTPCHLSYI